MVSDTNLVAQNTALKVDSSNKQSGWWQRLNLRTKATIAAVAIGTLPVILIGGVGYIVLSRTITEQALGNRNNKALEISDKINRFMFERYGDIQTLSAFEIFADPKLKISIERKAEILERFVRTYDYESINIINLDRSIQVQNSKGTIPKGFIYRQGTEGIEYLEEVFKNDKPVVGYPAPAIITKKFSLFAAAPIKVNGVTNAVIRTRIPIAKLNELLSSLVSEGDNYSISDPKQNKIFAASDSKEFGLVDKERFSVLSQIPATNIPTTKFVTIDGEEHVVVYLKSSELKGLPNLNWTIIVSTPSKVIFAARRGFLIEIVIGTGITAILVAVLAIVLANRATRPILAASRAVNKIGQGELDMRLEVSGEDEIAQLGGNINLMASQLQDILDLQAAEVKLSNIRGEISRLQNNQGLSELLTGYLEIVRTGLQCDRAVVYEFDAKFAGKITTESVDKGWTSAFDAGLNDPCIPESIIADYKQGRVAATTDVFNVGFAPKHLELMHKLEIKSNLVVPIRQAEQLFGLLIVHKCRAKHIWQEDEISYLRQTGEQLGIALSGLQSTIDKQQATDQERARSQALQSELINLLTDVEGAASGDLTVRAQITSGEIGIVADFFNAIIESLRDVVTKVKVATAQVSTSVSSNDLAIRGLSSEAIAQTVQVDDALRSVEGITSSIQEVARSAKQAADASLVAENTAEKGSTAIEKSVASILQLRETVSETAKKVKRLGESSQQISKVVALIDQIALKTNMLAVNASIEAARAGEEGRGFAVVAEEVGALAAQSAAATKEIERIVESIQQETSEVVEAMEASTLQVVQGTNQVQEARQSLGEIVQVSREVSKLFQGISTATDSQVQSSKNVSQLMSNIAKTSQQSSETSREVSVALQETVDVASKLQASVETFKVPA